MEITRLDNKPSTSKKTPDQTLVDCVIKLPFPPNLLPLWKIPLLHLRKTYPIANQSTWLHPCKHRRLMEDRPSHRLYLPTPRVYLRYKTALFLFLAFIDIVCGLSESERSYIQLLNPWTEPLAYPNFPGNGPSFNAYWFIICVGSRTFSSLRSRGELLVKSLSDLDWCLSVRGNSGFVPCMWHTTGFIDVNQQITGKFGHIDLLSYSSRFG